NDAWLNGSQGPIGEGHLEPDAIEVCDAHARDVVNSVRFIAPDAILTALDGGAETLHLPMRRNLPQPLDAGVLVRRVWIEPPQRLRAQRLQRFTHDPVTSASIRMMSASMARMSAS